jgi:allantoin racemase
MRIWFQLLASETAMKDSIAATQAIANKAASPGTIIEVHGTTNGTMGANYRLFWHYDTREVIANGLKVRQSGQYDAFVIANTLEPGVVELREMLDIPVISCMEVCCHVACMMGEKFGILVSNDKFIPRYREIVHSFGLRDRLASVEATQFDKIGDLNSVFDAGSAADRLSAELTAAARRSIDKGAEVLFATGPKASFLASQGIYELDGVPLLDCYSLLVKFTEAMVGMHKLTGISVSRKGLYQSPPKDLVMKAAAIHGIESLKDG